jgi:hypothetical protein
MTRVGAIVRLLMLLACAVPFTSARQAWAAINPKAAGPASPAPFVPVQEEEDTEREEAAGGKEKARTPPPPSHRPRAARSQPLYCGQAPLLLAVATSSPAPIDPFRNGLGCPFRC